MKNKTFLSLLFILIGAALIRATYLLAPHMDSDQAVFGLAGWHVLRGEFPIFQWGVHYMGTLQSYMDALFFAFFGLNRYVLNAVPLALSLVFIVVTYFLGKELVNRQTGLIAALLSAIGPYYLVLHGAWARHGYLETMIFGSLLILLTTKICYGSPEKKKFLFLWFGFVAGIAWWTNFLIVYYFIPCGFFLFWSDKKIFFQKNFYWLLLAFFIGSAPFWVYNFKHSFVSLTIFFKESDADFWKSALVFFKHKFPVILGIRESSPLFFTALGIAVYLFSCFWLITRKQPKTLLLPAVFVGIVFVLQSMSFYGIEHTERHLLPLYSVLPVFLAHVVVTLKEKSKTAGIVFLFLLIVLNIQDNLLSTPLVKSERITRFREDQATKTKMFQTLLDKNIKGAYTHSYWVGPVMTFDAKEKVVFPHPFLDRYPKYAASAEASANPAYLTVGGSKQLEEAFSSINAGYQKFNAAPCDFYADFKNEAVLAEEIDPEEWIITASHEPVNAQIAADRNLRSVWMSATRQKKGMTLTVTLPKVEKLCRLELYLGTAQFGLPESLEISVSKNGKRWQPVAALPTFWGMSWSETHPVHKGMFGRTQVNFPAAAAKHVRLTLTKPKRENPHYWAVAELALYRSLDRPAEQVQYKRFQELSGILSGYPKHRIYASSTFSAYLQEHLPKREVAPAWKAPLKPDDFKEHVFDFSSPNLFVVSNENKPVFQKTLRKYITGPVQQIESPPFTLFLVEAQSNQPKWYWTGKHLFQWKRKSK